MLDQCANPECSIPFDYRQGLFFRFRRTRAANRAPANTHNVQHFWLCGRCAVRVPFRKCLRKHWRR
jgi:hypothetical protein